MVRVNCQNGDGGGSWVGDHVHAPALLLVGMGPSVLCFSGGDTHSPCPTPIQARKKSTKINFLGPETARRGGVLPREGVVAKNFVLSLENLSSLGFESDREIHAPPPQNRRSTSRVRNWGWCVFCVLLRFRQFAHFVGMVRGWRSPIEERNLGCPGNFAGMSRTPGGVQKVCA